MFNWLFFNFEKENYFCWNTHEEDKLAIYTTPLQVGEFKQVILVILSLE